MEEKIFEQIKQLLKKAGEIIVAAQTGCNGTECQILQTTACGLHALQQQNDGFFEKALATESIVVDRICDCLCVDINNNLSVSIAYNLSEIHIGSSVSETLYSAKGQPFAEMAKNISVIIDKKDNSTFSVLSRFSYEPEFTKCLVVPNGEREFNFLLTNERI